MKKIHYIFIVTLVILVGVYFFGFKKDDGSLNLNYKEPDSVFFSPNEIKEGDIVVEITNEKFSPEILNIKTGDKVIFVNKTNGYSWPASDPHPTHTNYSLSSPNFDPELPLKPNEAWAFIFEKNGEWKYHDHLDPSKRGVINVVE